MNFIESISNYVLENCPVEDLPKIALIALSENLESESTYILAGLDSNENSFVILNYFNNSLAELNFELPSKTEAAKILTKYYLLEIIKNPNDTFEIMKTLDNDVYKQVSWQNNDKKYIGEELKIEFLYTWYREMQDWKGNGINLYYLDLNRTEQYNKFEQNLIIEAKTILNKYYS